ncbi:MAG: DNA polymerase I [Rikenellaceae bacterium]
MKSLYLIDAYALIFRYYYAFMTRPMRNREGMNTSIVFGFTRHLRDLIKRESPDLLGVVFDPAGGSFRREIFPAYKANRAATPEDIITSVPYVKRLVEAMNIPILEVAGYEADDVIGTLSVKGVDQGYEVFMVTPDKDYGQLVNERAKIYKQRDNKVEIIDRDAICEKYGIEDPILVRDILALWGDASDNIPGVAGIGEKTACKLVQSWGTVENIIANSDKIKGKQGANIAATTEELMLSKRLTTICLDVPITLDEESLRLKASDNEALYELFKELNFIALISELGLRPKTSEPQQITPAKSPTMELQGDLFAAFEAPQQEAIVTQTPDEEPREFRTAQNTPHTYHTVESEAALRELVAKLQNHKEVCFDTETTGLDPISSEIVGMSLCVEAGEAWYIPFTRDNSKSYSEIIAPIFEDKTITKIGQNIKFDALVLKNLGVELHGRLLDTMIMDYLIDAESRHNMTALARKYLNYEPIEIETLIGKGARQLSMAMVATDKIAEYAAEDADITMQLKETIYPLLKEQGLDRLYHSVEEPLIMVLASMEYEGVNIDTNALGEYAKELNTKLIELQQQIRDTASEPLLNINSPKQLGEMLFGKLKIAEKPKLTKSKQYCTDEEYLQGFASKHPIVELILEYRGVKKLLSTYVEALPLMVNSQTKRIHTSYNQSVTATGRLSSTNPNLQNIPIRDALGRPIRAAFIPRNEDHLLLAADYSQVELRIMAHLSGDPSLIEAFENGEDIHTATAAKLYGKSTQEVTSEERRRAKTANFGIIYGISAFGLSQRLDISRTEAKELIDGYFASYPKVKEYMDRAILESQQKGYVETLFGRRRYLRDITSRNAIARGVAERNAINAPIQGSAADIMKLAMAGIHAAFKREGIQSKMIMQVHDEVVIDTLKREAAKVREIVVREMEGAAQLSVKLTSECGEGNNWLEAH